MKTNKIKDIEKFLKESNEVFRVDSFYTDLYEFNGKYFIKTPSFYLIHKPFAYWKDTKSYTAKSSQ